MWWKPDGKVYISSWTLHWWGKEKSGFSPHIEKKETAASSFPSWEENLCSMEKGWKGSWVLTNVWNICTSLQGPQPRGSLAFYDLQMSPRSWASFSLEIETYFQNSMNRSGMLSPSSPRRPSFQKNLFRKPKWCRNTKIFFSISHSITVPA